MFTVALIGPDGSGKSTVARRLSETLPMPATYLYMGVNWDASNHLLPTTRFVEWAKNSWTRRSRQATTDMRPVLARARTNRRGPGRRLLRAGWVGASLLSQLTEEWYRQLLAWVHVRRGVVVIFDRHFFFDFYKDDVAGGASRSFHRRVHGFFISRVYPRPDLVIYLDAPADVVFARKGEATVAWIAQRRAEYLDLAGTVASFKVIDANRPLHEVLAAATETIVTFRNTSAG